MVPWEVIGPKAGALIGISAHVEGARSWDQSPCRKYPEFSFHQEEMEGERSASVARRMVSKSHTSSLISDVHPDCGGKCGFPSGQPGLGHCPS